MNKRFFKRNFIKIIFTLLIIAIVCVLLYVTVFRIINKDDSSSATNTETQKDMDEKPSGTLTLAICNFDSINPMASTNKNVQDISKIIFDSLISLDKEFKPTAGLAYEWTSIENKEYILKLVKDVKWHDGKNFTSNDVIATINGLMSASDSCVYKPNVKNIEKVEQIDESNIKIYLKEQDSLFIYDLTFPILPKHFIDGTIEIPVGTGMYKIESIEADKINLTYNTYKNLGRQAHIANITINLYDNVGNMYTDFKSKKVDFLNVTASNYQDLIGKIGYGSKEYESREYDFLTLNCSKVELSSVQVRKAIELAIDKNNIVSNIYKDELIATKFFLQNNNYFKAKTLAQEGYNTEAARTCLANDGWSYNKYGGWTKKIDNKSYKLSFNLLVNKEDTKRCEAAESIKKDLGNLGIPVTIKQYDNASYAKAINNRDYDIAFMGMYVSQKPNPYVFLGENNYANYISDSMNEQLNELRNTSDTEKMKDIYNKIQEIYKDEAPYISLYFRKNLIAYSPYLSGETNPTWFNIWNGIETWEIKKL